MNGTDINDTSLKTRYPKLSSDTDSTFLGGLVLEKSIPSTDTSVGNWTDGGQLFSPAIWPAPFCHKGSTSKQPRQVAQECGKVPRAAFTNILKAVPGL